MFDHTDDSRGLLHCLNGALDRAARRHGGLPFPRAKPFAVSVTLHRVLPREASSRSLFDDNPRSEALSCLLDGVNARFGNNTLYFGGMHGALAAAPMRIPFNRVPEPEQEEDRDLWSTAMNQAKVLDEAEHRRHEHARADRIARLKRPSSQRPVGRSVQMREQRADVNHESRHSRQSAHCETTRVASRPPSMDGGYLFKSSDGPVMRFSDSALLGVRPG